jgi:cell shape-determining protein MreD
MRPALALLGLGWLAVAVQGGLAGLLPGWAVPDLSVLVMLAAASTLEPGWGLLVAAGIGLGSDMVSAPPLGQLAFLRTVELALARLVAGQLDVRRGLPLLVFAFSVVVFDGLAQIGLGRLLYGSFALHPFELIGLAGRALVSAPLAPAALMLARRLRERLDETEARRDMRLDTRRPVLR